MHRAQCLYQDVHIQHLSTGGFSKPETKSKVKRRIEIEYNYKYNKRFISVQCLHPKYEASFAQRLELAFKFQHLSIPGVQR